MVKMADERSKTVSFGFSKKTESKKLTNTAKTVLGADHANEDDDERDFLHSAERNSLKSVKPKDEPKELVIPLQKKNRWMMPSGDGIDKEAMEEVIKEARKDLDAKEEETDFSIPMLLRNKLPDAAEQNVLVDIAMRPEQTTLDEYESMPVSAFGSAMLRGMGWQKGQAIGGTVKGLTEPIEYIPRSKGLGLGAERRAEMPGKKKRRKKPGDKDEEHSGPIVEKDGRVRHVKGVGEKAYNATHLDYKVGTGAVIEKGVHKDLHGKIIAIDVDNSRVTVCLHISSENVTLHQYYVRLIDDEDYKSLSKNAKSKTKSDSDRLKDSEHRSTKTRKGEVSDDDYDSKHHKHKKESSKQHKSKHGKSHRNEESSKTKCWLYPELRVRIISKDFKKGRYYNTKVRVIDVISRDSCDCETEDGKLLDDVAQPMLETVIPKKQDSYVRIVRGSFKGQLGTILQRDTSKCEAIVQLLLDKSIETLSYDNICEHLGVIREDFM